MEINLNMEYAVHMFKLKASFVWNSPAIICTSLVIFETRLLNYSPGSHILCISVFYLFVEMCAVEINLYPKLVYIDASSIPYEIVYMNFTSQSLAYNNI